MSEAIDYWTDERIVDAHVYLKEAYRASESSRCLRKHVGFTLVNTMRDHTFSGYNRPAQEEDGTCEEFGCVLREHQGRMRCVRTVHAEIVTLAQAKAYGFTTWGTTSYATCKPCLDCAKALILAGIKRCIFVETNEGIPEDLQFLVSKLELVPAHPEALERLAYDGYRFEVRV